MICLSLTTPANTAGAVALIQLHGQGVKGLLSELTLRTQWDDNKVYLCDFGGIDEGLVVCLGDEWAQLMPHGGLRVIELLCEKLLDLGCHHKQASNRQIFPEASSDFQADMLATIAHAPSPAAIDLLLAQLENWQNVTLDSSTILADTNKLDRLCDMPSIVVVGPANVGKSTLTNRMLGYAASIVADLPGTTRDWVGGMAQLRGVAVRWMDTPGIRSSDDAVEQQAIQLAKQVIEQADVLVYMSDLQNGFEQAGKPHRKPDILLLNKIDTVDEQTQKQMPPDVLAVSATTGQGMAELIEQILHLLGLHHIDAATPWAFSKRLKQIVTENDLEGLRCYMHEA
ncbi:MAG TPA: hypothetical protein DCM28_12590 [Phycisphaerales bacterium]|nr:hypothetical protein [Phycisphaerales bacterium]|tara:strand:+ start:367 stop:1389 length:1023 start_codon:yes stop_codon:yes gene_type:complete